MIANKACPVVLREKDGAVQILVFRHPAGDIQLVKGTIEPGEDPAAAAVRELAEESGITGRVSRELGLWESGYEGQIWAVFVCEPLIELPDEWSFFTTDDGGVDYKFFWHPLDENPGKDWHDVYRNALEYIKSST